MHHMEQEAAALRAHYTAAGQEHVFQFWPTLSDEQKRLLLEELKGVHLHEIANLHKAASHSLSKDAPQPAITPFANETPMKGTEAQREHWRALGNKLIRDGKVAVLLLAGGQGTRLGTKDPKGMYDIGMPGGATLFQMQAEGLRRVAAEAADGHGGQVSVPWYIMTSDATHVPTVQYFHSNNFFGLQADNVRFFQQAMLPCLTPTGKLILETPWRLAVAPNGNGGLYDALSKSGSLDDMRRRGVAIVLQYCVDNVLIKMADPVFIGFCAEKNTDVAAKVCAKTSPDEPVGVLCARDGKPGVIEYSEIPKELSHARNPQGELLFNAAHLCINMFHIDFLTRMASLWSTLPHHVAKKKIPAVSETGETVTPKEVNGWKLELFIFDVFEHAERMHALQIARVDEFSPLKNAPGSASDSPDTCRIHLTEYNIRRIERAGGRLERSVPGALCDVSHLLTDTQLAERVRGQVVRLPVYLH